MSSDSAIGMSIVWLACSVLANVLFSRSSIEQVRDFRSLRWIMSLVAGLIFGMGVLLALASIGYRVSETQWTVVAEAKLQPRPDGDQQGYLFLPDQPGQTNDQWLIFALGSDDGVLVPKVETTAIPLDGQNGEPRYTAYHGEPPGIWKYIIVPRETKYVIYVPPDSLPDES